jgi:hypothetical protein
MYSRICKVILLFAFIFSMNSGFGCLNTQEDSANAPQAAGHEQPGEEGRRRSLQPGDFIFDHIKDAHEWHVLTINHKHISIPCRSSCTAKMRIERFHVRQI